MDMIYVYVIPDPSICVSHVHVYVSVFVRLLCIGLNRRSHYSTRTPLVCIIEQFGWLQDIFDH